PDVWTNELAHLADIAGSAGPDLQHDVIVAPPGGSQRLACALDGVLQELALDPPGAREDVREQGCRRRLGAAAGDGNVGRLAPATAKAGDKLARRRLHCAPDIPRGNCHPAPGFRSRPATPARIHGAA